jgi:hypothetical protein
MMRGGRDKKWFNKRKLKSRSGEEREHKMTE